MNTQQYTPAPLVFGQDSRLNTRHESNWQLITNKHKEDLINKGNQQEILNQKGHLYNKGNIVQLKNVWKIKFDQDVYLGSTAITAFRKNSTVRAHKGKITDTFNIRNITPYKEEILFHYGVV